MNITEQEVLQVATLNILLHYLHCYSWTNRK